MGLLLTLWLLSTKKLRSKIRSFFISCAYNRDHHLAEPITARETEYRLF